MEHVAGSNQLEYLLSGSEDFSISVWIVGSWELVCKYNSHSGPIKALFKPMDTPDWKGKFFSVGEDRTVRMFHLENPASSCTCVYGNHPSSIVSVSWRPHQDFLMVKASDGSVSVWEIGTGQLEGRYYGDLAKEIFKPRAHSKANLLYKSDRSQQMTKMISTQPVTGIDMQLSRGNPFQVVLLNVNKALMELHQYIKSIQSNNKSFVLGRSCSSYKSFSYLIPWGIDSELDELVTKETNLLPPDPRVSYGLIGTGNKMCAMLPSASKKEGRWILSDTLSASHSLATIAITKCLLVLEDHHEVCSNLLSHIGALLPEKIPDFVPPSLIFLARFWQDPSEDIMQSARTIFRSTLDRLSPEARKDLAKSWSEFLKSCAKESKTLAILVLAIQGIEKPDSLDPDISNQVACELLDLISFPKTIPKWRSSAIELLAKGFEIWSQHISDTPTIIHKLFTLTMVMTPVSLVKTVNHALMLIGARDPRAFIKSIAKRFVKSANQTELLPQEHGNALLLICNLIKKYPGEIFPELPLIVEIIVQCLDPHVPNLRDACLKPATSLIHDLVRRYPMVVFQQTSQRLVVGTNDGVVFIYDLTSATRWHTIEGHRNPVTAVCFSLSGKSLATYAIGDSQIKLWRMGNHFFGILGGTPQCYKTLYAKKLNKQFSVGLILESVRLQWPTKHKLLLIHVGEEEQNFIV
eukprot:TRINITY_DN2423_c0_g1_i2.p1 TRINITY_DN2423_c0_g1~~TRINITY_DN2423_c0_g1_i2.p1  ORF type:complete len:692 (-),score=100.48 TRINITY_DN2423_c0_g1_i2:4-2079(-)